MSEIFALQLGGLHFEGGAGLDGFYVRSQITGWDSLPDARGSLDPIPGGNGSFEPVDVWRESRAISIPGVMSAGSRREVEAMRARLMSMLRKNVRLTVTDETDTLSADVRVESVTTVDEGTWAHWIDFEIDLLAFDSVRYRDTTTVGPVTLPKRTGGLVFPAEFPWHFGEESREIATVTNPGDIPVLPRMTMTGSADSVVIHGGPNLLSFGAFSGTLVLDSRERRAWLNGVDVTRQLVRRDWPMVPAGAAAEFFFKAVAPSADISLTIDYRIGVW